MRAGRVLAAAHGEQDADSRSERAEDTGVTLSGAYDAYDTLRYVEQNVSSKVGTNMVAGKG